jgi:HSP20 family protein
VLTVSIPVAEKARARKIQVQRADTPMKVEGRTIEGQAGAQTDAENKAVEA